MDEKNLKRLLVFSAILIALVSIVLGTKLALYLNFLLGNDIVVKLETPQAHFHLKGADEAKAQFSAQVATNLFCSAKCSAQFWDLSNGILLDETNFSITPSDPEVREYVLKKSRNGFGTDLYSFTMSCHSVKTFLCASYEISTKRSALISVTRSPSDYDLVLKDQLRVQLIDFAKKVSYSKSLENSLMKYQGVLNVDFGPIKTIDSGLEDSQKSLGYMQDIWSNSNYSKLNSVLEGQIISFAGLQSQLISLNQLISREIDWHNLAVDNAKETWNELEILQQRSFVNNSFGSQMIFAENEYEKLAFDFNGLSGLDKNNYSIKTLKKEMDQREFEESISLQYELNLSQNLVCSISTICPPIVSQIELNSTCDQMNKFSLRIQLANLTLQISSNISDFVSQKKSELAEEMLADNPDPIAKKTLEKYVINASQPDNITVEIEEVMQELKAQLLFCNLTSSNIVISPFSLRKISPVTVANFSIDFSLQDPAPVCCLNGACRKCCTKETCTSPKYYPILLINGYGITKDNSAEYSLDSFNGFQSRLTNFSYINGGAITLYTKREAGTLESVTAPVSFRVSYYFDVFEEPENYVFIPTSSENLDTYSIRLKTLIDSVKGVEGIK